MYSHSERLEHPCPACRALFRLSHPVHLPGEAHSRFLPALVGAWGGRTSNNGCREPSGARPIRKREPHLDCGGKCSATPLWLRKNLSRALARPDMEKENHHPWSWKVPGGIHGPETGSERNQRLPTERGEVQAKAPSSLRFAGARQEVGTLIVDRCHAGRLNEVSRGNIPGEARQAHAPRQGRGKQSTFPPPLSGRNQTAAHPGALPPPNFRPAPRGGQAGRGG